MAGSPEDMDPPDPKRAAARIAAVQAGEGSEQPPGDPPSDPNTPRIPTPQEWLDRAVGRADDAPTRTPAAAEDDFEEVDVEPVDEAEDEVMPPPKGVDLTRAGAKPNLPRVAPIPSDLASSADDEDSDSPSDVEVVRPAGQVWTRAGSAAHAARSATPAPADPQPPMIMDGEIGSGLKPRPSMRPTPRPAPELTLAPSVPVPDPGTATDGYGRQHLNNIRDDLANQQDDPDDDVKYPDNDTPTFAPTRGPGGSMTTEQHTSQSTTPRPGTTRRILSWTALVGGLSLAALACLGVGTWAFSGDDSPDDRKVSVEKRDQNDASADADAEKSTDSKKVLEQAAAEKDNDATADADDKKAPEPEQVADNSTWSWTSPSSWPVFAGIDNGTAQAKPADANGGNGDVFVGPVPPEAEHRTAMPCSAKTLRSAEVTGPNGKPATAVAKFLVSPVSARGQQPAPAAGEDEYRQDEFLITPPLENRKFCADNSGKKLRKDLRVARNVVSGPNGDEETGPARCVDIDGDVIDGAKIVELCTDSDGKLVYEEDIYVHLSTNWEPVPNRKVQVQCDPRGRRKDKVSAPGCTKYEQEVASNK